MRGGLIAVLIAFVSLIADIAAAENRPWVVVPAQSEISMSVRTPLGMRTGRFERWSGDIRFDPESPLTAQVGVQVETASLRMDDAALTRTAVGTAFLDSARFPRVSFRLTSLEPAGTQRFTARAEVTVKGVTRPVSFPVTLRSDARSAQMDGGFSLDRAAFGIGTGGPWNALIGRQVRVEVSLATRPAT